MSKELRLDNQVQAIEAKRSKSQIRNARKRRAKSKVQQVSRNEKLSYHSWIQDLNLSDEAVNSVLSNISNIERGNDQVLLTPMGKINTPEAILQGWDSVYEGLITENKLTDTLMRIESENRSKYGPRSIQKNWEQRKESLYDYFKLPKIDLTKIDLLYKAVEDLKLKSVLRPLTAENAIKFLKNNTSSGLPLLRPGRIAKQQPISEIEEQLDQSIPSMTYTRTQENDKTRNVWGFPFCWKLEEMKFYQSLLQYQKKLPWRSALRTPEDVDSAITDCINKAMSTGAYLVSIDFSAYDASIHPEIQKACFKYISDLFQSWHLPEIDRIRHNFTNIPIVTPDGLLTGPHGVPSGSTFTNEVDSIAQFLVSLTFPLVILVKQIQGDDGVYVTFTPEELQLWFGGFCFDVNDQKTMKSLTECTFLQKYYSPVYVNNETGIIPGIYSTYRALLRLVYQERFTDLKECGLEKEDYFAIRSITILENCKHHPYFKDLVRYVLSIDDYLETDFSGQTLQKYVELTSDTASGRIFKNQYGDDVMGIQNFETFKIIKEILSE